ncbi:hypothetical protein [Zoogloea sp.]|jgi:hypothetical protein|uniref:hypothetical protein n=1 Tax=Zoogloea sp. TaxID=49181 RepID=UPI0037DA0E54
MARTATIRISQGRRGTTIRATGGAAQALFDAITGAAAAAKAVVEAPAAPTPVRKYLLCVRVEHNSAGCTARALVCDDTDESAVGLERKSISTHDDSERAAVEHLLTLATPRLRVVRWKACEYANQGRTLDFTVIAEAP